jgi:hypothetical protein
MAKVLVLENLGSYRGHGVRAIRATNPYCKVDDKTAEKLLATGYFAEIPGDAVPDFVPEPTPEGTITAESVGARKTPAAARKK